VGIERLPMLVPSFCVRRRSWRSLRERSMSIFSMRSKIMPRPKMIGSTGA